jgi:hypothetical protein
MVRSALNPKSFQTKPIGVNLHNVEKHFYEYQYVAQLVQRRPTGWVAGIRFPTGERDYSLLHSVQTGSGAHPASYPVGTGSSFPWTKAARA